MTRKPRPALVSDKPLLSVDEVAILLGESRSILYRSLKRGDLPLPVFTINGRLRFARRAVERLIEGLDPSGVQPPASPYACEYCHSQPAPPSRRRPTCSAARRSSSGTPSV